ncbi:MAG: ribose-phosphate diphosphokinase [Candidatus Heimdallarchaeota archaeon]|nr:ribose-phosphate diphosphokinase [Candidatus Heimdallarchaeota archaeon]
MTTIISGPGQPHIGEELAELLQADHISVEHKFFPDGERDMILSKEQCDPKTIIVQSLSPPQDSNLVSLLQLAYTAEEFGAKEITLVTPYLAYAAKDRRILTGEVVSIFNVFKMIEATPAQNLYMIDIHNPDVLKGREDFYQNFSAMPAFGEYYQKKNLQDPLILAPDEGAKERVKIMGEVLEAPTDYFEKSRDPVTGETTMKPHELDVEQRDVIIADELIRTGGTIVKAVEAVKKMGVKNVFVASTHLMLLDGADKKIFDAGAAELIGTDSLPSKYAVIPAAPLIKEQLEEG